jgi:hypothetical protein
MWEWRVTCRVLVGKPEGRRLLGRPRCRWEDDINIKLHNMELNDLYCSPNIIRVVKSRRMRWAGHVARMWEWRVTFRVLVGKPQGKRLLGRPKGRREDDIQVDIQQAGWGYGLD